MQVNLKMLWCLFFVWPCFFASHAQSITEIELGRLADSLVRKVKLQMTGQNIAIAEFVDINGQTSNLGKYLAEDFTYSLTNRAGNYHIIDRSHLRTLLDEAGVGEIGMVNPESAQKLGRLEGVTAIVYGKLVPTGNEITVYINVVILEKQVNVISVRGKITRTITIDKLFGAEIEMQKRSQVDSGNSSHESENAHRFIRKNINLAVSKCIRKNGGVYCEFTVSSQNIADNFFVKTSETSMKMSGGKMYYPSQVSMNGKSSSIQANRTLQKNETSILSVWFSGVPNNSNLIDEIQLNCSSSAAFSFIATFQNVTIK